MKKYRCLINQYSFWDAIKKAIIFGVIVLPVLACNEPKNIVNPTNDTVEDNASKTDPLPLPDGSEIVVHKIGNDNFISVSSIFLGTSFNDLKEATSEMSENERNALYKLKLNEFIDKFVSKNNIKFYGRTLYPEYGFFKGLVSIKDYVRMVALSKDQVIDVNSGWAPDKYAHLILESLDINLSGFRLSNNFLDVGISSVMTPDIIGSVGKVNKKHSFIGGRKGNDNDGFSGLKPIKVFEFEKLVLEELGTKPTGKRVKVGVIDTGITFGHLGYNDKKDEKSRITRMGEFSGEGRIFFHPNAPIKVVYPVPGYDKQDVISIEFQRFPVIAGVQKPIGDKLEAKETIIVKASEELRQILLATDSPARVGVFSEKSFLSLRGTSIDQSLDLNQNKKIDDNFYTIFVPGADTESSKIYFSRLKPAVDNIPAHYDFQTYKGIRDWNTHKESITILAETFGFQMRKEDLLTSTGTKVPVHSASIVGVDPGLHGSHVAGIIGAKKTFINDPDDTKARGVAPEAELMLNRVCASNGCINMDAAMIDLASSGAEVINVSIGGLPRINDGYAAQTILINRLTEVHNTLFAISAGNSGSGFNTTGNPSNAELAVSVAATATPEMVQHQRQIPGTGKGRKLNEDFTLYFSSRGPDASGGFKPNISAPGSEISLFPLNNTNGNNSGSGWMHGTSMAAPTFAGAVALLLDGVKIYNEKNPDNILPTDVLTLRKILLSSARPFNVTSDNKDKEDKKYKYTWIDQGAGIVDLVAAWKAIKAEKSTKIESPVWGMDEDGKKVLIDLKYGVKILHTGPNKAVYDGKNGKYAKGLWLDHNSLDKIYSINLSRMIPESYTGEMSNPLKTLGATRDRFRVKTRFDGAEIPWLKVGTLNQTDCENSKTKNIVSIHGKGMAEGSTKNDPLNSLNICVLRSQVKLLPPGDHGALIHFNRTSTDGTKIEKNSSFTVPVFVSIPKKKLANREGFVFSGTVGGYQSLRHYIDVPKGVTAVSVKLSIDEAKVTNGNTTGCSFVIAKIYEGNNNKGLKELSPRGWVRNCTAKGAPNDDVSFRTLQYGRLNPRPGTWVFDMTGHGTVRESAYKLEVHYASVKSDIAAISELNGEFDFSYELSNEDQISVENSSYLLHGLLQSQRLKITKDPQKAIPVPDKDGVVKRVYDATKINKVIFTTGNTKAPDVDLMLYECDADSTLEFDLENACAIIKRSTLAASDEIVSLLAGEMKPGKAYVPVVIGYNVIGEQDFEFQEKRYLVDEENADPEKDKYEIGVVKIENGDGNLFKAEYQFSDENIANSRILNDELHKSGKFEAFGDFNLRSSHKYDLFYLPVRIIKN